jgi:hypothetical protein
MPSFANKLFALVTDPSSDFQPEGLSKLEVNGPNLKLEPEVGLCANAKFGAISIENV